jgi:lysophospholipase L1-like esterase
LTGNFGFGRPIHVARLFAILCIPLFSLAFPSALQAQFKSAKPEARVEYWQSRLASMEAQLADEKGLSSYRLVFLGDSITDFFLMGENLWFPGVKNGRTVWDATFAGQDPALKAINLGISGDRIEHMLYRIEPKRQGGLGQLDHPSLKPDYVIILAGINNSWASETPADASIVAGVQALVASVHARQPKARIILQSLMPTQEVARTRDIVIPVNRDLKAFAEADAQKAYITFVDLYPHFLNAEGRQDSALFYDGLHPSEAGYKVWRDVLVAAIAADRAR